MTLHRFHKFSHPETSHSTFSPFHAISIQQWQSKKEIKTKNNEKKNVKCFQLYIFFSSLTKPPPPLFLATHSRFFFYCVILIKQQNRRKEIITAITILRIQRKESLFKQNHFCKSTAGA
jgi:hypothetical protein